MKIATCELQSASPYSQGRYHATSKLNMEGEPAYEERTWRERVHADAKTGEVFIPPMAFKNCLSEVAKFLSLQIAGKGSKNCTKLPNLCVAQDAA